MTAIYKLVKISIVRLLPHPQGVETMPYELKLSWNQIYTLQQLIGEELERIYEKRKTDTRYHAAQYTRMIRLEMTTDKLMEMRKTAY